MRLIRDEPRVWLDAGPFFRFSEGDKLRELAKYLGDLAHWTVDVASEVERRATSPNRAVQTHPRLQNLRHFGFPAHEALRLDPDIRSRAITIAEDWAKRAEARGETVHPRANRGEIGTVLHAAKLGGELVVLDDADGIDLAKSSRNVYRRSSSIRTGRPTRTSPPRLSARSAAGCHAARLRQQASPSTTTATRSAWVLARGSRVAT